MNKRYQQVRRGWSTVLIWLLVLAGGSAAQAQSGPVGNEWIVPGQQYYKVKIRRDGLYKLDYQYLTQAGIGGVAPSQLQVWRRGRELATYVGGNAAVLDPSTFVEFFARHNDGQPDVELYKNPGDMANRYTSYGTDTASYFITWGTRAGKRMAQPVAAAGTPHPHRLLSQLNVKADVYSDIESGEAGGQMWLPWADAGEGFFSLKSQYMPNQAFSYAADSLLRAVASTGPAPQVEVQLQGASRGAVLSSGTHLTEIFVLPPNGTARSLGIMQYNDYEHVRQTFTLLRSDINSAGRVDLQIKKAANARAEDYFFVCYLRFVSPQQNQWFADRYSIAFQNDSLLGGPATYDVAQAPATAAGFDVQDFYNVQRVVATAGAASGSQRFVFPGANAGATHELLLADEAHLAVPPLPARLVRFRQFDPARPSFIIISHRQLMKPVGSTANPVRAYAAYRASAAGGAHDTLVAEVQQLYDQFTYGDRSWLALRHFARWMVAARPDNANRFLFLLGKGINPSEPLIFDGSINRYNGYSLFVSKMPRGLGERGLDLIPTSLRSISDNLITADYATNGYAARIATGRLAITTPQQVMDYLEKIQQHGQLGDEPWRKNVIHLSGGADVGQMNRFAGYMDLAKKRVERPLLGGRVIRNIVHDAAISGLPQPVDISTEVNAGVSLITYLGHGSPTSFLVNIDDVNVPNPNYTNRGRYPVLYYSGCVSGAVNTVNPSFIQSWLLAPNRGAIGALAQTNLAYETQIAAMQDTLYKVIFNSPQWYGKSVAAAYNETVRRLQRGGSFTSPTDIQHLLCMNWSGDPSISIYAPAKPDFQTSNARVAILPSAGRGPVTASSPTFELSIGVSNPGKIPTDSLQIRVVRTYPNRPAEPLLRARKQGWKGDTIYSITIANQGDVTGVNQFRVELDYANRVDESNESNNTAQISYTFLKSGVTLLSPPDYAIVGRVRPRLVAQTNDPLGASRGYEFQVDTTANFTSPLAQRLDTIVTATLVPSWRPVLPTISGRDSVVWYWRVRFQQPVGDEDANWIGRSFRVINGSSEGWSQSHYAQLQSTERTGVDMQPSKRWRFADERRMLVLSTVGAVSNAPTFNVSLGYGIIGDQTTLPSMNGCAVNAANLIVAVYDKTSLKPKRVSGGNYLTCSQASQPLYIFADPASADTLQNFNNSGVRQSEFNAFLASVADGDYVALISANRVRWTGLPYTVKTSIMTYLGSQLVDQLRNGDGFALLAQKQSTGGRLIREIGPTAGSETSRTNQQIRLVDTLRTSSSQGRVLSTRIGPAQSWETLHHWVQRESASSSYSLRVIGLDSLNAPVTLVSNASSRTSLANISARQYPYLQLELTMQDSVSRLAPQLKEWFITYRGLPEGIVRRDLVAAVKYSADTLAQQASSTGFIKFPVKFENVTTQDFGTPLKARVDLRNAQGQVVTSAFVDSPALKAESTVTIPVRLNVDRKYGDFTTHVVVNPEARAANEPRALLELHHFNNELTLAAFTVKNTNLPPVLDVAFDGRRILNGELVSPAPVIQIQLNDDDHLHFVRKPSAFSVTLQRPGQSVPTVVSMSGSEIAFRVDSTSQVGSVAKLEYQPGKNKFLEDGMYTLRVRAQDPSGVPAGGSTNQDYEVKFEVVNASTITNVFPYPNPVTSKAHFVFTLTGMELPRNMKIQIMTLTGRVVREIFMNELGPLHIGNNLTDYAWDGTDEFGDRLANGTYLYRVSLDDAGGQFSKRNTAADKAFKNDWGKLVLLR